MRTASPAHRGPRRAAGPGRWSEPRWRRTLAEPAGAGGTERCCRGRRRRRPPAPAACRRPADGGRGRRRGGRDRGPVPPRRPSAAGRCRRVRRPARGGRAVSAVPPRRRGPARAPRLRRPRTGRPGTRRGDRCGGCGASRSCSGLSAPPTSCARPRRGDRAGARRHRRRSRGRARRCRVGRASSPGRSTCDGGRGRGDRRSRAAEAAAAAHRTDPANTERLAVAGRAAADVARLRVLAESHGARRDSLRGRARRGAGRGHARGGDRGGSAGGRRVPRGRGRAQEAEAAHDAAIIAPVGGGGRAPPGGGRTARGPRSNGGARSPAVDRRAAGGRLVGAHGVGHAAPAELTSSAPRRGAACGTWPRSATVPSGPPGKCARPSSATAAATDAPTLRDRSDRGRDVGGGGHRHVRRPPGPPRRSA